MKKIVKFSAFMLAAMVAVASISSCGEEDIITPSNDSLLASKVNFDGLKAIAQSTGKIKIEGVITSDKKLKEFEVLDENDNVIATLGDKHTTFKEKDENGKKVFTMTVTSDPIDVQILKFRIKAGVKKPMTSSTIGAKFSVTIGSSGNKEVGSYLCLSEAAEGNNGGVYMQKAAQSNPSKIDVIAKSSEDSYDVLGIQRATKAKASGISTNAGKTALFDGNGNKIEDGSYVTSGTIITDGPADACIAKVTVTPNSSNSTAEVKGIVIKNSDMLPLDVSAFTFSK
ncbi:MAG: hypothetical protein PUC50_09880 [Bacteroidales bacterium]|nr:hypothetical protein [Bacteroidales bacterium]